jgi:arylsulfatase A-like enzyme
MKIKRRAFLKKCLAAGAGGYVLSSKSLDLNFSGSKPNIVFIFIDDMGWTGTGFNGSGYYETKHIDKLSTEGMVFTNAYTCAPNCAPTRATLLSGTYGPRTGVFTVGTSSRLPEKERLIPVDNNTDLATEVVTYADALKAGGYATACVGKWHLGKKDQFLPPAQGFEFTISRDDIPAEPDIDPKRIEAFTDNAISFMESAVEKNRPFMLYMSHHTVHSPIEATAEMTAKYEPKTPWQGQDQPNYAAMTEHTDDGVGRLLERIDELGIRDNTMVIFYSDNGGPHGMTSNYPLRGAKGMLYEGGIRVPMIVRWPGVTRPGSKCDEPVNSVDFFPTFLEVTGTKKPTGKLLDGLSIVPLLKGKKELDREALFWHFPTYLQGGDASGARDTSFRTKPVGAIRKGKWKLLQYFEEMEFGDGPLPELELYDLEADMAESTNLADINTAKRDELLADLEAWRASVNAPVPNVHNPYYTG